MSGARSELDVEAVREANSAMYAAVEAADLEAMAELWISGPFADSAVCVHPGWAPIRGRSRVLRAWALIMANTGYIQFFLTDVDVTVSDDVATVTCVENILTGVGGDPTGGDRSGGGASGDSAADGLPGGQVAATNIFRRTPGGWRVWVHHGSPVLALAAGQEDDVALDDADEAQPGEDDR